MWEWEKPDKRGTRLAERSRTLGVPSSTGAPSFVSIRELLADISPSRETVRCQTLSESHTKELPDAVIHLTSFTGQHAWSSVFSRNKRGVS